MGRLGKVRGLSGHPRASFFENEPPNQGNGGFCLRMKECLLRFGKLPLCDMAGE
jgi:hypothetical protein